MTISFENDNNVIIYALEKIISFAWENQYIFVAQCIWWIVSIIGLQSGLVIHIDNLAMRSEINCRYTREISTTPRDIARQTSDWENLQQNRVLDAAEHWMATLEQVGKEFISDPLQWTWHEWINPLSQTKAQYKRAQRKQRQAETQWKAGLSGR